MGNDNSKFDDDDDYQAGIDGGTVKTRSGTTTSKQVTYSSRSTAGGGGARVNVTPGGGTVRRTETTYTSQGASGGAQGARVNYNTPGISVQGGQQGYTTQQTTYSSSGAQQNGAGVNVALPIVGASTQRTETSYTVQGGSSGGSQLGSVNYTLPGLSTQRTETSYSMSGTSPISGESGLALNAGSTPGPKLLRIVEETTTHHDSDDEIDVITARNTRENTTVSLGKKIQQKAVVKVDTPTVQFNTGDGKYRKVAEYVETTHRTPTPPPAVIEERVVVRRSPMETPRVVEYIEYREPTPPPARVEYIYQEPPPQRVIIQKPPRIEYVYEESPPQTVVIKSPPAQRVVYEEPPPPPRAKPAKPTVTRRTTVSKPRMIVDEPTVTRTEEGDEEVATRTIITDTYTHYPAVEVVERPKSRAGANTTVRTTRSPSRAGGESTVRRTTTRMVDSDQNGSTGGSRGRLTTTTRSYDSGIIQQSDGRSYRVSKPTTVHQNDGQSNVYTQYRHGATVSAGHA